MKNYWRMGDFSIFSVPYAYVDHSSYQADQLFVQNKVRMKFKGECAKADSPYRIVFCKVRKRDVEHFEEALDKLKNKMLLLPQIVFWNVASRNSNQPVTKNEQGVALVSGCTPRLFSMVASGELSPYTVMMEVLESERYAKISA